MDDITGIGRGNPALQTLFKSLEGYQPDEIPSPEERKGALGSYIDATKAVGTDTRNPFQVMVEGGLASDSPTDPYVSGKAGLKALLSWEQNQRESKQRQEQMAAKLQYEDILQRRKDAQNLLMTQARGGRSGYGTARPVKLADGTWGVFDPVTQSINPLASTQAAALDRDYDTYYKLGEKSLDTTDPQVIHEWVLDQIAKKAELREANPAQTTTGTIGIPPANIPGASDQAEQQLDLPEEALPPEVQGEVQRLITRLRSNPSPELHRATLRRLQELQQQYAGGQAAPQQRTFKMKGSQTEAEKKGYGAKTGETMAEVSKGLQQTASAAQDLMGDVNMMTELYSKHGDVIPEGEQAGLVASVKSSLKTFGIEAQGSGITDVVRALGTKQALKSRTADGQNLLPGAMSNYEDMLLQKMSPTLTMTQEGRLMMLQIIKAQLQMKIDLAAAAREYVQNKGRLDEGWYAVADKYARNNPFLNEKRIKALEEYTKRLMNRGVKP